MKNKRSPFTLCFGAVILIVLLRIAIGWHYFYEGVHKFDPAAEFSAEGFLGIAKGVTADIYYWMLPDHDGLQRLELAKVKDENGKEFDTFIVYENAWKVYFDAYLKQCPEVKQERARAIYNQYLISLRAGAADVKKDVEAFLASRERFIEVKKDIPNNAAFEQKRRWDMMTKYRSEAAGWTKMLTNMGNGLQSDLGRLLDPELAGQKGEIVTDPERALMPTNPLDVKLLLPNITLTVPPKNDYVKSIDIPLRSRMNVMDWAVTFGLSAIGLCMMIGFCNRLACLGGVAFLINVVLTTYPVPGVYPPLPSAVGNFMFVSKDVVEMFAMLFLASIPAGRWGGLDFFLWHCGGKQVMWLCCYPFCKCSYKNWLAK